MYLVFVVATTIVLPLIATIAELGFAGGDPIAVAGKWFVLLGVGIRLLVAGLSQIFRPSFTSRALLGIETDAADQIVQELGFANIGMGAVGLVAFFVPAWLAPVAAVAGLFLLLAGVRHVVKRGKSVREWVPTITDLVLAVVLLVFAVWSLV